eukprot:scaffold55425_cov72-Phaeocystis_antarctica.AAC.3
MQRRGVQSRWGLQGKWHRAGSACSTGQACSAGQACAGARLVCSADQACRSAGEACGQLRGWRGNEGTRGGHTTVGTTCSSSCCTRLKGRVCGGHRAHRCGLVQLGVLVGHLDQSGLFGGGSTVAWGRSGDRVCLHVVACAYMVARRGQGPSCPPAGWAGDVVSSSAERRAHGVRREAPGRTRRQRREHMKRRSRGRRCKQAAQRAHPVAPSN